MDWPFTIFVTSTFLFIHWVVLYLRPISAPVYIICLVISCYIFDVIPDYHGYFCYQKYKRLHRKIKNATKELGAIREKVRENGQKMLEQQRKTKLHQNLVESLTEDGIMEKIKPLKRFPSEVWRMIFDKLEETKDVMSCYYTCDNFRSLLEVRKNAMALQVLDEYLNQYVRSKTLSNNDLLNCRLVSKSWKLYIDHSLQHHPCHLDFFGPEYPATLIDSRNVINMNVKIHELIRVFPNRNVNPFPSRHVVVRTRNNLTDYGRRRFHAYVWILLNLYGDHIWYLRFNIFKDPDGLSVLKNMYSYLQQTPNVRMLDFIFHNTEESIENGNRRRNPESEAMKIEEFVKNTSFPKFEHLKALVIDGVPEIVIDRMLKINRSIEKLDICSESRHEWIKYDGISTPNLPNLTDFAIYNVRVAHLAHLENVTWPLTRLALTPAESHNEGLDLEKLFKIIEKFEGSLKFLNLKIIGHSLERLRLTLPKLEQLHVHFYESVNIDFTLPLRSLKLLKVYIYDTQNFNNEHELEIVRFKDHVIDLHKNKTNIWQLFPELIHVGVLMIMNTQVDPPSGKMYMYEKKGKVIKKKACNATFVIM